MQSENDDRPTMERGSYGDRGSLESNRPDGYGSPSDDQPNLPNPQAVKVPGDVTPRPRK